MRIGLGFDVHKLVSERKLFLGGVEIPFKKGLLGHSDADVLLHAIADAILGAAGLPDIGQLFPDDDPKFLNYSSSKIVEEALKMIKAAGFSISNIDAVVICEKPRIMDYKEKIRGNISNLLGIGDFRVSIKGKTVEGLGVIGSGDAIACFAVSILEEAN